VSGIVVMGAVGGCGTTTLACAVALAHAAHGQVPLIADVDAHCGGPSDLWCVPATRALDDLLGLGDELRPEHLEHLVHRHSGGMDVMAGCRSPAAAVAWAPPGPERYAAYVSSRTPWVADAGRADTGLAAALVAVASLVVALVPRSVHSAQRAAGLLARTAGRNVLAVATDLPVGERISDRALGRAIGTEVIGSAPRDDRNAARVAAGQAARGKGIARAVAAVLEAP